MGFRRVRRGPVTSFSLSHFSPFLTLSFSPAQVGTVAGEIVAQPPFSFSSSLFLEQYFLVFFFSNVVFSGEVGQRSIPTPGRRGPSLRTTEQIQEVPGNP